MVDEGVNDGGVEFAADVERGIAVVAEELVGFFVGEAEGQEDGQKDFAAGIALAGHDLVTVVFMDVCFEAEFVFLDFGSILS